MYRTILVPLDGSRLAEEVLPHARALVERSPDARIILLRVVPQINETSLEHAERSSVVLNELAAIEQEAEAYLAGVAARLRDEGFHVVTQLLHNAYPEEAIVDYAARYGIDLITIATHGWSGIRRWIFGSVTQKVIQAAPAPIMVIRPNVSEE